MAMASAISFSMVMSCILPSLLQCPPKLKRMDAMPSLASERAMVGIGVKFLLEKMPCMRMTMGHVSVWVLKWSGRVMVMASPPCGPWTSNSLL